MKMNRNSACRKNVTLPILFVLILTGLTFSSSSVRSQKHEKVERKLVDKISKEVPLRIHAVRNLHKPEEDEWFRDLEIEVKNISDKPIYFISLSIIFPMVDAPPSAAREDGVKPARTVTGFPLYFGNPRLGVLENLAEPDDEYIKPGETYTFKIPEGRWKGLLSLKRKKNLPPEVTGHLEVVVNILGFGDGTGYIAGRKVNEQHKFPKAKASAI